MEDEQRQKIYKLVDLVSAGELRFTRTRPSQDRGYTKTQSHVDVQGGSHLARSISSPQYHYKTRYRPISGQVQINIL